MGLVYLPTFSWFLMINVGKYTSPMDPMALIPTKRWHVLSSKLRTKTEVWHPAVENPSHPRSLGARWSVDLLPPGGACVGFNLQPSKLGDQVVATQIFFIFTPHLGKWSNLTDIFFGMGWFNHQLGRFGIRLAFSKTQDWTHVSTMKTLEFLYEFIVSIGGLPKAMAKHPWLSVPSRRFFRTELRQLLDSSSDGGSWTFSVVGTMWRHAHSIHVWYIYLHLP